MQSFYMHLAFLVTITPLIYTEAAYGVMYKIFLKTGDAAMPAGTSAFVNISGEMGWTADWLEPIIRRPNMIHAFDHLGPDVGNITDILVTFNGDSQSSTWKCEYMIVYVQSTNEQYFFDINHLFVGQKEKSSAQAKPSKSDKTVYKIIVHTGKQQTSGEVFVNLLGTKGETGMHRCENTKSVASFQANKATTCYIAHENLGQILTMELKHKSDVDAWMVDSVDIKIPSDFRDYSFRFGGKLVGNDTTLQGNDIPSPLCFQYYKLDVQTTDVQQGVQDVKLQVQLMDETETEYEFVPLPSHKFQTGSVDVSIRPFPCQLDKISNLTLKYNVIPLPNNQSFDETTWTIGYISVTDMIDGAKYYFPINQVLAGEGIQGAVVSSEPTMVSSEPTMVSSTVTTHQPCTETAKPGNTANTIAQFSPIPLILSMSIIRIIVF